MVYELSLSNGTWQETTLYRFDGTVGAYPISPISIDQGGTLYGTFLNGGTGSCFLGTCGGVFKLVPQAGDEKKYVFYFNGGQASGNPESGVMVGGNNTVYGTVGLGDGNVYMLKDENETILYSFCSLPNCADGLYPSYGTLVGHDGALYGPASAGGQYGFGVVYSVIP